jgi:RNA polymerase sigma factor (sigma-70 family)
MSRAYSVEREELLTVGKIAIMEAFCTYDQATAKGSERTWVRKTIRWRLNGASWREKSASDPEIFVRDEAKTNGRHDPEKANLKSEILAALERLPPRQRTILDGRLRGETYQEIAGTLGISHQRVQQEAQTAYTALREWIES